VARRSKAELRRARPKKDEAEKATIRKPLYFTPVEWDMIEKAMDREGARSFADWARPQLLAGTREP
jgi:hypothetical protein